MTGQELKKKREERGLSLEKFAKELQIPKATLYRWEKRSKIKPTLVPFIKKALQELRD